jgi:type IX secretion system PorP/SprF family membrane protein
MQKKISYMLTAVLVFISGVKTIGQENIFTHYFIAASCYNPAHAGDTRFGQFQFAERIQPTVTNEIITHTFFSYDQKLRNHRSGIGISFDQQTARFTEQNLKLSYSHTLLLWSRCWLKGGLGISFNSLNTHAGSFHYPDQYDRYGFTGQPTQEVFQSERVFYPGVSAGLAAYTEYTWLTIGFDNLNRPVIGIIEDDYRAPLVINASWGLLIPYNKNKRPRRIISPYGGLEPYSSIGPVISYHNNGPFHVISIGVNAFTQPLFWGVNFRYNTLYKNYFTDGAASLNFLAGYRIQSWCLAYSYDFMISRTPTNYKGAHEISVIYYLYSSKEDHKLNKLFPFPNQLMY